VEELKMDKVKKILVPIDFSSESAQALRDASTLARETAAQLIALHVIDEKAERDILLTSIAPVEGLPFRIDESAPVTLDVMLRERTLDLWNFVDHVSGATGQASVRKVIKVGKLTNEITIFMRDEAVDLLVLKLQQRRLIPDFTTLKLVKIAGKMSCPVLLDPPARRERQPRQGLLLLDLLAQLKSSGSRQLIKPMTS
jgi:nucleotide-binding universal stress UspA family protein